VSDEALTGALDAEPREMDARRKTEGILPLLATILGRLPFGVRSFTGLCLGYLVGLLPFRERTFTRLQLAVFLPEVSAKGITPWVFANAGQTLLESLNVRRFLTDSPHRITCDAWSRVQDWRKDPRPIVCLTAHTGNWDLLAAWVISKGIPLTTIGREARKPSAQAVLKAIRDGYGIETIWRSDRSGLKRLISCLKERRVLAALIDQDTRVESISVPFFGEQAKTPVSLITLGRKMNARFVTAFIFRTGWMRFSVFIEEVPELSSDQEVLRVYNQRLEALIRRFPDQWVWFHKRWRSPPGQETLSSKAYEHMLRARLASTVTQEADE
jgi:KDO2-lipid IV(A) lauroyltransferase